MHLRISVCDGENIVVCAHAYVELAFNRIFRFKQLEAQAIYFFGFKFNNSQ